MSSSSGKLKAAVYDDSSGTPNALLGESAEYTISSSGWQTIPITTSVTVPSDGKVWVAFLTDSILDVYADTGGGAVSESYYCNTSACKTWSSPFSDPASTVNNGYMYSVGYVYSATSTSNIIEATGQSISTSVPSHLMFTRDASNGWEIFLDGTSIQTATDSTSLGTALGETATQHDSGNSFPTWYYYGTGDMRGIEITGLTAGKTISKLGAVMNAASGHGIRLAAYDGNTLLAETAAETPTTGTGLQWFDLTSSAVVPSSGTVRVMFMHEGAWGGTSNGIAYCSSCTTIWYQTNAYTSGFPATASMSQHIGGWDLRIQLGVDADPSYYIGQSPSGTNTLPSLDEFAVWTSDKGAEASDIYDRGANQFAQVGSTTGSTVTHSDNNSLTSGDTYYHRIIANNGAFDSNPSNVSQSAAGVPPDAPTNLQASINNPNTAPLDVTLTWTDGAGQGTGTFQNYIVIRSPDASFTSVTTVGTPTATTFTDTVPSGGGTFYYKVSDQSSHGGSPNSAAASVTTPSVPDAPTISLAINNPDPSPLTITTTFTPCLLYTSPSPRD